MQTFFTANMFLVFFVYGLAFFTLGIVIAFLNDPKSRQGLARALPLLALFGLSHGLSEWGDMFLSVRAASLSAEGLVLVRFLKLGLMVLSFYALLAFAARLLPGLSRRRWVIWLLVGLWALLTGWALAVGGTGTWAFAQWETWGRYLLYAPGALAVFWALRYYRGLLEADLAAYGRYLNLAAWTFLLQTVFGGLVVPKASFFPANALNYASFLALFHLPVQLIRAVLAVLTTVFFIPVLQLFRAERERSEADRVQELEGILRKISEHAGQVRGVADTLKTNAAAVLATTREIAAGVRQALGELNRSLAEHETVMRERSRQWQTALENLGSGASRQEEAAGAGSSVSGELLERVTALSQRVREVAEQADLAAGLAADSAAELGESLERIRRISDRVEGTREAVQGLADRFDQIDRFLEAIKGIAGQTNLLALNAAIEAARAGQEGRGFAVVADEVRKLAVQAASSAADIGSVLAEIRESLNRTLLAASEAVQEAEEGSRSAEATRPYLERIRVAVAETSRLVREMAAGGEEVAAMGERLRETMSGLDELTKGFRETAAGMVREQTVLLEAVGRLADFSNQAAQVAEETGVRAEGIAQGLGEITGATEALAGAALDLEVSLSLGGRIGREGS